MATREKVAAVAIDDPQIAENAAHEPIVAAASAPRMPEKSALAAAKSSEDMFARDATAPMKIKFDKIESMARALLRAVYEFIKKSKINYLKL